MTISAFDRLGQIKGAGDERALFLKLGIAEVLAAFDRNCVFKGKVRERNITGGKSAKRAGSPGNMEWLMLLAPIGA